MSMFTRPWPWAAMASLSMSVAARAEAPPLPPLPPQPAQLLAMAEMDPLLIERSPEFVQLELDRESVVKGAPYCADAVHETVQTLMDGNRIVRQQKSRLCRDGEGRTRQEVERGGRTRVYLRDPVAQQAWVLDPQRKSAMSLRLPGHWGMGKEDNDRWRDYAQRMREWSREFSERMRQNVGRPGTAPAEPPALPEPPRPPAEPVAMRIVVDKAGAPLAVPMPPVPPVPAVAPLPPAIHLQRIALAPRGKGEVTALGSRSIAGVQAHGERTTWTIEAGKVGNEKPIHITREVWTSPELKLTLQSRDFDPRSGEVNYRLENLQRGEPDVALFKVPADYQQPQPRERAAPRPAPAASPHR